MDRGDYQVAVHGVAELDKTEQLSLSLEKGLNKMFRNYKKIVIN